MSFEEISKLVREWANQRDLLHSENALKQYAKFQEEGNELLKAILNEEVPAIVDAIGDVLVTIIILSEQLQLDSVECLLSAYKEIKNRTGKTVNGEFIKD